MKKFLRLFPISLYLAVCTYTLTMICLDLPNDLEQKVFYLTNELIGNGLLIGIYILVVCVRHKYCWYNIVSAYGMILLSLVNYFFMLSHVDYLVFYNAAVTAVCIPFMFVSLILLLSRK